MPSKKIPNSTKPDQKSAKNSVDPDDERTFSNWLKSEQGTENLKLFVLGNALVLLFTVSFPKLCDALDIIYKLFE